MHKFVIWGVGRNGRALYEIIGGNNIVAYIDKYSDRIEYKGIPIISVEEYAMSYSNIPMVISVDGHEDSIRKELANYGDFLCFDFMKEIEEIRKFSLQINKRRFKEKYITHCTCRFVGHGLFALLASNYFEKQGLNIIPVDQVADNTIDFDVVLADKELYYHEEIEQFKNCHKGNRCFIIGNGPSLDYLDLEKLYKHNEICFGINGIFKAFERTKWRPDYYIASDPSCMFQWKRDILEMNVRYKFISDIAFYFRPEEMRDNILCWHMYLPSDNDTELKFSDDFAQVSYNGDTVIYDGALQLAAYMGFDEIYLLGVDCTLSSNSKDHFIRDYQGEEFKNATLNFDKHLKSYLKAKEYFDLHGVKVFNATRGGALEVFNRIDFDTLF